MTRPRRFRAVVSVFFLAAGIAGIGALVATSIAAQGQQAKVSVSKEQKLAEGELEAKKMLVLMDKDKNGKVSKQEFMNFMEAEFERLDVNKDGELDVKELTQSRVQLRSHGR